MLHRYTFWIFPAPIPPFHYLYGKFHTNHRFLRKTELTDCRPARGFASRDEPGIAPELSQTADAAKRTAEHGGDVEQAVEALLTEGDRTLRLTDWRDTRSNYMEALRLAQESDDPSPLVLVIFQPLGDLQWTLGQYVIAHTYYEAARCWTRTPREQALLLCRLAESRRAGTSHKRAYLNEAVALLPQVTDPAVRDWVQFQQPTDHSREFTEEDLARILALSKRIEVFPDLPREYFACPNNRIR